jgi:HAE1 family hydrophobic/amphiphilic exporter-1
MWLRPRSHGRLLGGFFNRFNRLFERASNGYVRISHALIRKAVIGIALLAGFAILTGALGRRLPTSFVPEEDYGYFLLNVQLPPAASLQRTDEVCRKVETMLSNTEGLAAFNAIVGFSLLTRVTAPNNAFYFVGLKPWEERRAGHDARTIVNQLNAKFRAQIPEAMALAVMPPAIPGLGSQGGFTFWLQDRSGGTIATLDDALQKFLTEARKRPELAGVGSPFSANVPQVFVDVDRDRVLKEGIALTDVYQTLQTFLGGLYVNQFNRFGRQWRVFLQAEGEERTRPDSIAQFYVRNNDGNMVPMSSLQSTRRIFGPQYTNRFNVYRAAQVTGAAAPGYSSGQALDALEEVARATLPADISYDWSDLSYQERKASGNASRLFALSIVFVFLILAALYESWSLPFSVLLSVPVAVVGAFAGLLLRRFDFDVYAQVGVVMLIGLAAKNAILIVEFAKARREEGKDAVTAALEGAKLRLRPILMTSFAFILGCAPLWIADGAGAASRRVLGTVVISGMLAATLFAIFLIPMLYVQIDKLATWRSRTPAIAPEPKPSAS